jgi:hypothetical protein
LKILKVPDSGNNVFRFSLSTQDPKLQVRFPPQTLQPRLLKVSEMEDPVTGEKHPGWAVIYDFQKVPGGATVDLLLEYQSPWKIYRPGETSTTRAFDVFTPTAELDEWILMPAGKLYKDFRLVRYQRGRPETVEPARRIVANYMTEDATLLAYKLMGIQPGYTYENIWSYK